MSLFGAISRTAAKAFHSNNRFVLRHSQQNPNYVSNRFLSRSGKTIKELESKLPERPKRPQSGYNIFYKDLALKLRAENPDLKIREMAKAIGNQWNSLDTNVRQEILQNSRKDGEKYRKLIEEWRKSLNKSQEETYLLGIRTRKQGLARRRLKVELKRLDYPQRPKSAFNLFIKEGIDNRGQTDQPYNDVFKGVVAKWKTLSPEEREPYIETAKNDKIRYLQELNEWQEKVKRNEKTETLNKLTKLRTLSARSALKPDLKKKTKKVLKKRPKAKKLKGKTKTSLKLRAKPKVKSSSKSKTKAAKPKTKKSSKPKSSEKSKQSKTKTSKKADKKDSSDSSDE